MFPLLQKTVDPSEVKQVFPHGRVAVEVVDGGLRAPEVTENGVLAAYRDQPVSFHQSAAVALAWQAVGPASGVRVSSISALCV